MSIFFISGHLDLTHDEFIKYYKKPIDNEIKNSSHFIIGDARGADTMAQTYIHGKGYTDVCIFHIGEKPRNNVGNFNTTGGFESDKDRDKACTMCSEFDIAYCRSKSIMQQTLKDKYKEGYKNGTYLNIERRTLGFMNGIGDIDSTYMCGVNKNLERRSKNLFKYVIADPIRIHYRK